ncbi:DNA adenine methylase [Endothiovibrio diazotrophicus]
MFDSKPIIPWIGGKGRLLKEILPLLPEHTCYVEACAGAAAVFFGKPPSDVEVINDVQGDVVNLYRVVANHLDEFVRQFRWALTSRTMFEWENMKRPETLTDIQRAARFYYLQRLSFGGRVAGRSFGTATTSPPRLNLLRIEEELSAAHLRLANVYVEHGSWHAVVERYDRPHTLHYLDPPYWETEGYGVDFPWSEYERMADMATTVAGAVLISINDHPAIRALFIDQAGLHHKELAITYTVGGGGTAARELLLWNDNLEAGRRPTGSLDLF